MSGHTPGPWILETHEVDSPHLDFSLESEALGCRGVTPASFDDFKRHVTGRVWVNDGLFDPMADALLIAAAPDLLEALKDLVQHDRAADERDKLPACMERQRAEDIIAKAEGRK